MKKNIFRLIVIAAASPLLLAQSCNDKFLQLSPETELSKDNSLKTETELTLYLNNLFWDTVQSGQMPKSTPMLSGAVIYWPATL